MALLCNGMDNVTGVEQDNLDGDSNPENDNDRAVPPFAPPLVTGGATLQVPLEEGRTADFPRGGDRVFFTRGKDTLLSERPATGNDAPRSALKPTAVGPPASPASTRARRPPPKALSW